MQSGTKLNHIGLYQLRPASTCHLYALVRMRERKSTYVFAKIREAVRQASNEISSGEESDFIACSKEAVISCRNIHIPGFASAYRTNGKMLARTWLAAWVLQFP